MRVSGCGSVLVLVLGVGSCCMSLGGPSPSGGGTIRWSSDVRAYLDFCLSPEKDGVLWKVGLTWILRYVLK